MLQFIIIYLLVILYIIELSKRRRIEKHIEEERKSKKHLIVFQMENFEERKSINDIEMREYIIYFTQDNPFYKRTGTEKRICFENKFNPNNSVIIYVKK